MNTEKYKHLFTPEYMMGPNTISLLDEMLERHPLKPDGRTLDLGCGTGLSSLYLAQETGATVFAVDLWCSATDNLRRFKNWNKEEQIIPIHADALDLPFADEYFDAIVSVDAYHYFACNSEYFPRKLLPLVKRGGEVRIIIPGLHEEFGETIPPEMLEWAGDDCACFHSCEWWKNAIGTHPDIASVEVMEMESDARAWQDWFDSGHKYGLNDRIFFEKGIGKYLNFVGIVIRKAE